MTKEDKAFEVLVDCALHMIDVGDEDLVKARVIVEKMLKVGYDLPKMEWISVKDRLPDENLVVVVAWGNNIALDYIDEEMWGDWFNKAEYMNLAGAYIGENAPYTHWLVLPTTVWDIKTG